MTFPARWTRIPSDVEPLFLDDLADVHCAETWLRGHGVPYATHPALAGRGLLLPRGRTYDVARLGQVLVRDVTTGGFAVVDDDEFRALHRPVLDAIEEKA